MFTSRAERTLFTGVPATHGISPGQYNVNVSSLRSLNPQFPHKYKDKPDDNKTNFINRQIRLKEGIPAVGQYNPTTEVEYIRLARRETAAFASTQTRFCTQLREVPGPGEYENKTVPAKTVPIRPHFEKLVTAEEDRVVSIPYEVPKAQNVDLKQDTRATWITQSEAGKAVGTPSPFDYDSVRRVELPKVSEENRVVPVGGLGGSSLLRYDHVSPWSVAPVREILKQAAPQDVGPTSYSRDAQGGLTVKDAARQSSCMQRGAEARFDYINYRVNKQANQMPYYEPGGSICERAERLGDIMQQQRQYAEQQAVEREIMDALHPSIGPQDRYIDKKEKIGYLSAQQQHQLDHVPSVGSYDLRRTNVDRTAEVQARKALNRYLSARGHGFQPPSIPLLQRDVEERKPVRKPAARGILERQALRGIDRIPEPRWAIGPGSYELPVTAPKAAMCLAKAGAHDLYAGLRAAERDEIIREQSRRRFAEECSRPRDVGGESTVINYNLARQDAAPTVAPPPAPDATFQEQRALLENPGVGQYDITTTDSRRLGPRINRSGRVLSHLAQESVPDSVCRRSAAAVVATRLEKAQLLGPQSYQAAVARAAPLKKSFNATCDENRID